MCLIRISDLFHIKVFGLVLDFFFQFYLISNTQNVKVFIFKAFLIIIIYLIKVVKQIHLIQHFN